mmetsp:Transcript_43931/g.108708  ORF Transcript_43931/g.108708 Transcript_43931/m.108708 type:complete len:308 (+) Transcript_43931:1952-2875(+)
MRLAHHHELEAVRVRLRLGLGRRLGLAQPEHAEQHRQRGQEQCDGEQREHDRLVRARDGEGGGGDARARHGGGGEGVRKGLGRKLCRLLARLEELQELLPAVALAHVELQQLVARHDRADVRHVPPMRVGPATLRVARVAVAVDHLVDPPPHAHELRQLLEVETTRLVDEAERAQRRAEAKGARNRSESQPLPLARMVVEVRAVIVGLVRGEPLVHVARREDHLCVGVGAEQIGRERGVPLVEHRVGTRRRRAILAAVEQLAQVGPRDAPGQVVVPEVEVRDERLHRVEHGDVEHLERRGQRRGARA